MRDVAVMAVMAVLVAVLLRPLLVLQAIYHQQTVQMVVPVVTVVMRS